MCENVLDNLSEKEMRYDDLFFTVLQSETKIEPFIDYFFRFLYRRTDFFLVQETAETPYGFPTGAAKQMILKAYQKYDNLPKEKLKNKLLENNEEVKKKLNEKRKKEQEQKLLDAQKSGVNETRKTEPKPECDLKNVDLKKKQEIFQKNPASYNGALRDNYSWTQSIKDIDVQVKIGPNIKSSKEVKVKIEKDSLFVSAKKDANAWDEIVNENLAWKVKPEECTWSLFPGDHIHIYLEKIEERWWDKLLANEEKLDLQNMNPEKPMEDLDEEAQAKIKQMMYDEQQKRLGRPTSEQQKYNEVLKKAWDAEGSPFKGMPFDPSVLKMPNDMNTIEEK